jgi:hypothetical protein
VDLERFASDRALSMAITITVAIVLVRPSPREPQAGTRRCGVTSWRRFVVACASLAAPAGWYTLSPLWERSHLEGKARWRRRPSQRRAFEAAPPVGPHALPTAATRRPRRSRRRSSARITHGQFQGADDFHFGRGQAQLIETAPGRYTLRFEDFSVRNGPDLFVYLSPDEDGYIDGAVNLGELKATDGAFNYELPADVTTSRNSGAPLSGANASQSCSLRPRWNRYNRRA